MFELKNLTPMLLSVNDNNDDDYNDEYETLPTTNVYTHMMAGGMAGMMEHVIMYPLDSVKTRMQTLRPNPNASYRSVPEALYKMIRYEGLLRPIKGVSAIISSAGPAHALYYSCYEKMKTVLSGTNVSYEQTHLAHGIAGCLATVLHDAMMNPAEVIKARMQVYNSPYTSAWSCATDVWRKEGWRAFYRSYYTSLMMNIPFQSIHFITYEVMQNTLNRDRNYDPKAHMISGAIAGGFAAAITTPLDVCKTLINTQEKQILQASRQNAVSGFYNALTTVYKCCGIRGYFQGMQARVLYSMPATAISWSVYEFLKYFINENNKVCNSSSSCSSSNVHTTTSNNLNNTINLSLRTATVPVGELGVK